MSKGPAYALAAAALFGASTPLAKMLLGNTDPVALASVLYLGSGIGLALYRALAGKRTEAKSRLGRGEIKWLAGAILLGGVIAPILLLGGLQRSSGATASLLLNAEGVLTALLAWFMFRENFDRRIAAGMAAIAAGAVVLSWGGSASLSSGALAIIAACACWALDNNLTRNISASDPIAIAMWKGLAAGSVNAVIALARGAEMPDARFLLAGALLGLASYGVSLSLFVTALREIGTARTGAYFSTAPFIGAVLSVLVLHEEVSLRLVIAGCLMLLGVWLHLTERHAHPHTHEVLVHSHAHRHDEHHHHEHAPDDPPDEPHSHSHLHEVVTHEHDHHPDIHHRHDHR
ncbi:MAG: DMT family transporter [Thermoanaerobaculia bacterium]|nr:DMT family transporter [Thermoanaerobaculia bacterium]